MKMEFQPIDHLFKMSVNARSYVVQLGGHRNVVTV